MSTKEQADRIELLQGTLDLLIMRTLLLGPAHGHAIAKAIEFIRRRVASRTGLAVSGAAPADGQGQTAIGGGDPQVGQAGRSDRQILRTAAQEGES